ncbi:MAG: hypothetical protein ACI9TH_004696 [Kiritimatiellia bacterium]|jgi:hypothetical protein
MGFERQLDEPGGGTLDESGGGKQALRIYLPLRHRVFPGPTRQS